MSSAARRGFKERLRQNRLAQIAANGAPEKKGNRAMRRNGSLEENKPELINVARFRRALDKALRGPREK